MDKLIFVDLCDVKPGQDDAVCSQLEKLGFSWKHHTTDDKPPKCVFDIEIKKNQKQA